MKACKSFYKGENPMKKSIWLLFLAGMVLIQPAAAEKYKVRKTEDIQRTLAFADTSGPGEVLVDNIFGSITVEGYTGKDVRLFVRKTIKARSQEVLERAQQEVKLDISTEGRSIDLYVDGPFRDRDEDGRNEWRNPGYQVQYDFEIKVPKKVDISLKTVTEGDIVVNGVEGDFDVRNVNGKVTITEIAGSGRAHTVNGAVKVVFTRNPREDCSFKTVNGDLDVYFTDNLSADFRLKTFHGDMLTDFSVKYLPLKPAPQGERKGGKYVYRGNRFVGVQTGGGGPEMIMDTLNGDILIHKR
jgi:hypothetical protein